MAKISLVGVDNIPGNAAKVFAHLAKAKVVVNDIMQTEVSAEKANLSFMIEHSDLAAAVEAVEQIKNDVNCRDVFVRDDIAEVSVVGVGMRSHYGVAEKMFGALAKARVNIDSITTSEIRISCAVDRDQAEKALEAVCLAFELDKPAEERGKDLEGRVIMKQAREYTKTLDAHAEAIASPIEHAISIRPEDVEGCQVGHGVLTLLCFLRKGDKPKEPAKWCASVLEGKRGYSFHENCKIYVQTLDAYPKDVSNFVAAHPLHFCEHHGLGDPLLENLIFEERLDAEGAKTIIYSVKLR